MVITIAIKAKGKNMFSILLVLLVIVAVLMTGLILLQKSEGSGMSGSSAASMFGGVLTGSAAGNFLTKTTAWLATIFFILCALLSLVVAKSNSATQHQSELRQELTTTVAEPEQPAVTEQAEPASVEKAATKTETKIETKTESKIEKTKKETKTEKPVKKDSKKK